MNKLILTVGLPRSGKTTWALKQGHPIVNPDAIRLALHGRPFYAGAEAFVWAIAKIMVKALFGAGHGTVILDATNVTAKRRAEWKSDEWQSVCHVFDVSQEECKERAILTDRDDLLPVIDRMAEQWDWHIAGDFPAGGG